LLVYTTIKGKVGIVLAPLVLFTKDFIREDCTKSSVLRQFAQYQRRAWTDLVAQLQNGHSFVLSVDGKTNHPVYSFVV